MVMAREGRACRLVGWWWQGLTAARYEEVIWVGGWGEYRSGMEGRSGAK